MRDSRDGASRDDRPLPALAEDYIGVDEMSFEQLLAHAAKLSKLLAYYGVDDAPSGTWGSFFITDEAILIGVIKATDLRGIEREMARFLTTVRDGAAPIGPDLTSMPTYDLARRISVWHGQLSAPSTPVGAALARRVHSVAREKLRPELPFLRAFMLRCGVDEATLRGGLEAIWPSDLLDTAASSAPPEAGFTRGAVKRNYDAFANAVGFLQAGCDRLLEDSLTSHEHDPAIAQYVAFTRLFQKAQQELNGFARRHREFYYDEVLKSEPTPFTADRTYLLLKTDAVDREGYVEAGTEFPADTEGTVFTADEDLLVDGTQVSALRTLWMQDDSSRALSEDLPYATGIAASHVDTSEPRVDISEATAWPLFGAPEPGSEQPQPERADVGFIIASPVLLMAEGEREIRVRLRVIDKDWEEGCAPIPDLDRIVKIVRAATPGASGVHDAFHKVFRRLFRVGLTVADGWHEVRDYQPSCHLVDADIPPDCLEFRLRLAPTVGAVGPYSPDVHGGDYGGVLPLLRFLVDPDAYVYLYSFLAKLVIRSVDVEVGARAVRRVRAYNQLGPLATDAPFQPFGPQPEQGSYFIIGVPEAARKTLTRFEVDVEWGGLPSGLGGLDAHYSAYSESFDESLFTASVTALRDGVWGPTDATDQQHTPLFDAPDEGRRRSDRSRLCVDEALLGEYQPYAPRDEDEEFGYDAQAKSGFFRFTLASPEYGFGHREYPTRMTAILTANARLKRARLEEPLPNPPYVPTFNSVSVSYSAVATIDLGYRVSSDASLASVPTASPAAQPTTVERASTASQLIRVHPFGHERVTASSYRGIYLMAPYEGAGHLMIGLSAPRLPSSVTLFFHLTEGASPRVDDTDGDPTYHWHYLSSNRWQRLERRRIVSDSTAGFARPGVVCVRLPRDMDRDNTVCGSGLFWLRVAMHGNPASLGSCYGVHAHGLAVSWRPDAAKASRLAEPLPAGTITGPQSPVSGVGSVIQILDSFDGAAPRTGDDLRHSVRARLGHKNRATTPKDYEQLILERFPEVYRVKCFCGHVRRPAMEGLPEPGHVLIVVVPQPGDAETGRGRLGLDRPLLAEIQEFVAERASPFVTVRVRNPVYERLQVRCTPTFRGGAMAQDGFLVNRLNQDINAYLSPWTPSGLRPRFGWAIRLYDVESRITDLDYVDDIDGLSMLRITDMGDDHYDLYDSAATRDPSTVIEAKIPWSLAIPMRRHFIQTLADGGHEAPQPLGIREMAIGSTFIVSRRQDDATD